jgi:hypothetical protein
MKLARESVESQLAKAITVNAGMDMRENCAICLEYTDVSKIHAVEGCAHRFCFSCMKEHVKVKLLHGMLPACPQDGCTKQLTVEGSKVFLSPRLLGIMVRTYQGRTNPSCSEDLLPIFQVLSLNVLERSDTPIARIFLNVHCRWSCHIEKVCQMQRLVLHQLQGSMA